MLRISLAAVLFAVSCHAWADPGSAGVKRALERRLTAGDLRGPAASLERRLLRIRKTDAAFDPDTFFFSVRRVRGGRRAWILKCRAPFRPSSADPSDDLPFNVLLRPDPRAPHRVQALPLANPVDDGGPIAGEWIVHHGLLLGEGGIVLSAESTWYGGLQAFRLLPKRAANIDSFESEIDFQPTGSHFEPNGDAILCTRDDDYQALDAPHAGPLLGHVNRYRFKGGRFRLIATHVMRNALNAFDCLCAAVGGKDWRQVRRLVPRVRLRGRAIHAIDAAIAAGHHLRVRRASDDDDEAVATAFRLEFAPEFLFRFAKRRGEWRLVSVK